MTTTELFDAFTSLRSGSRDGQRLPHKPLLVLLALGRWENGERGPIPFRDIEQKPEELIRTYGPRGAGNPQEPFWRLRKDEICALGGTEHLVAPEAVAPPALRDLREGVTGQFAEDVRRLLSANPALVGHLARVILDSNFPPSLHVDIAAYVGLDRSDSCRRPPQIGAGVRAGRLGRLTRRAERPLPACPFRKGLLTLSSRLGDATISF